MFWFIKERYPRRHAEGTNPSYSTEWLGFSLRTLELPWEPLVPGAGIHIASTDNESTVDGAVDVQEQGGKDFKLTSRWRESRS